MVFKPKGSKTVDPILGSRLFNTFWLAASLGGATLQLRLLAQALSLIQADGAGRFQGTLIACFGIAWLVGELVGHALCGRAGRVTWGTWLLGTALAWLVTASSGFAFRLPIPGGVFSLGALGLLAFLLALFSFSWMGQERPWPALRTGTRLTARLIGVLVGLCAAWLLPDWSGTIGVVLLLPLLSLDLWPAARCPLQEPRRTRVARTSLWVRNAPAWNAAQPGPAPAVQRMQVGWWWFWLASRRLLSLTLMESATTVILSSVWLVVPTLYALTLARVQGLGILLWLLGGQLCALLLSRGVLHTPAGRSLLATSAYTIGPAFHKLTRLAGWGMPVLIAACLGLLGNPWLQAPWLLGLAIAGYTLALELWLRLFPRLLRERAPATRLARPQGPWILPDSGDAPNLTRIRLARDDLARHCVSRWERAFLLGMALLTGSLCDLWGVDPVLVLAGCALMGIVALAMLCARYSERPVDIQDRFTSDTPDWAEGFPNTEDLQPVSHSTATRVHLYRVERGSDLQEPMTEAQQPINLSDTPNEHSSNRYAAQYSPFPIHRDDDGGFNSSAIH